MYQFKKNVVFACVLLGVVALNANVYALDKVSATPEKPAPEQFDLLELRVKGNSILDPKVIERTVYPFLGLHRNIDQVDKARSALEEAYKAGGYHFVMVDIPEQDVVDGVVYLQVTENKISKLKVKDSRYFSLGKIKAAVPELAEGNSPNLQIMQKQLTELAGESPDRQITPILRAGETPGTLEVDLKVKDELPLHGRLELNSRNTSTTSLLRTVANLRYDNLWQSFHSASLMYQVSPEIADEVDVWAGTYAMPLFNTDARLAVYAVSSSSSAQVASAGALSVIGIGNIYGARLVKPLKAIGESFSHNVTLGVDYKDFQEDLRLIGSDNIKTPIAYTPFLAEYTGNWRTEKSQTSLDLASHFSVRGLGNSQKEFDDKRFAAKANYLYLTGDLKSEYDLPMDFALAGHVSGQVADTPLISNEQFSLGGAQNVRGYFETTALSDDGVFGSLELHSPHLGLLEWEMLNQMKLLAFFDAGKGWIKEALPGNRQSYFLSSAGLGLRFKAFKHLSGALDVGVPFTTVAPVNSGDTRIHFNIAAEF